MDENRTTIVVQRYLDELAVARGDTDAGALVSALLGRSARRLEILCNSLLNRSYPRLVRPPLGLDAGDLLGAVVERLLKALQEIRPGTVRSFFALAGRHMRWELNDLARRLDERGGALDVLEIDVASPPKSDSGLAPAARRMLDAIGNLPQGEREALDLVRIHGMTQVDAADLLGISVKTVQRRLQRALIILAAELNDLRQAPSVDTNSLDVER
ncbi:sigma-70 family RNA polymerase sigma factor [Singulisphaera rosea]